MSHNPVLKKAKAGMSTSPNGLLITAGGKLQVPYKIIDGSDRWSLEKGGAIAMPVTLNVYGFPIAEIGNYVSTSFTGLLTAGTVGMVVNSYKDAEHSGSGCNDVAIVRTLDGMTESLRAKSLFVLTPAQVQEVVDYYVVTEKRPERIAINILTHSRDSLFKIKPKPKADWIVLVPGIDYIE